MAAATTILAGVAIAGGVATAASGAKQKRDGKRAARRFKRQELKNAEATRRISTRGADLAREEMQRATATNVEALQAGGVRGSVGGAGRVQDANNTTARQIAAGLDEQQVQLDREIAADERRIRGLQEGRDNQELSNIQQQVNAGNQQMWQGFGDIASGAGGLASSGAFAGGGSNGADFTNGEQAIIDSNNPAQQSARASARSAFGNTGASAFGGSPINPITGQPYGI